MNFEKYLVFFVCFPICWTTSKQHFSFSDRSWFLDDSGNLHICSNHNTIHDVFAEARVVHEFLQLSQILIVRDNGFLQRSQNVFEVVLSLAWADRETWTNTVYDRRIYIYIQMHICTNRRAVAWPHPVSMCKRQKHRNYFSRLLSCDFLFFVIHFANILMSRRWCLNSRWQYLSCWEADATRCERGFSWFLFPRASERRVLLKVGVCQTFSHLHIFSSSHLLIFTSSHLYIFTSSHLLILASSHPHILTSSHLTSSHLLIFTSSHLRIITSSHLTSSHLLIFTSSHLRILTSSHPHIFTSSHLHIFSSSHLLIFTSSHPHIFTSSHLLIFTSFRSSHLHIFSSSHLLILASSHPHILTSSHLTSSHLLIFTSSHFRILTSSHPHIFTSSHLHIFTFSLALLLSCPLALSFFSISLVRRGAVPTTARNASLSHETRFDRQKLW